MESTLPTPALWRSVLTCHCHDVSLPRLLVEAFAITLAVIALVWLGWVALWLLEHRW